MLLFGWAQLHCLAVAFSAGFLVLLVMFIVLVVLILQNEGLLPFDPLSGLSVFCSEVGLFLL